MGAQDGLRTVAIGQVRDKGGEISRDLQDNGACAT